jgi:hypothetical protein
VFVNPNCDSVAEELVTPFWVVVEVFVPLLLCVVVTVFCACAPADSAIRAVAAKISFRIMEESFRSLLRCLVSMPPVRALLVVDRHRVDVEPCRAKLADGNSC